jgi:hypothetical protein
MKPTKPEQEVRLLERHGDSWHVRYTGSGADQVRRLFGTDLIPTPYRTSTPVETVRGRLAPLNPGVEFREVSDAHD